MAEMPILYSGNDQSYTTLKQLAQTALTTTGKTFSWSVVSANTPILAAQINEIKSAIDTAYSGLNTGCSSKDSGYCSGNYGDYACSSDNGSDLGSYNSSNDNNCISYGSCADNSSNHSIVKATYNSQNYPST